MLTCISIGGVAFCLPHTLVIQPAALQAQGVMGKVEAELERP